MTWASKMELFKLFNPHSNFIGLARCGHKNGGIMWVGVTAESVIETMGTKNRKDTIIAAG